jgi:hypothetical protein
MHDKAMSATIAGTAHTTTTTASDKTKHREAFMQVCLMVYKFCAVFTVVATEQHYYYSYYYYTTTAW